ncbi:MAG: phage major capsid protein [Nitrococcus sp.]|nr:phage major capsid protein [Nitrococcus sp.]
MYGSPFTTGKITDGQALAARRIAGVQLRKAGLPNDIKKYDPDGADWKDICALQGRIPVICRGLLDRLEKGASEAEAKEVEEAYDGLMTLYDELDAEKDYRKGCERAQPDLIIPARRAQPESDVEYMGGSHSEAAVLAPEQRYAERVHDHYSNSEYGQLTLGRYLRSMVLGANKEVERRALAEGTDSAGGYTVPTNLSAQLIDLMRANTVAIAAGAQTVALTTDATSFARLASDPIPAWRAENAAVGESDPTFESVAFTPVSLTVLVKVSRELLEDSFNLDEELPRILAAAMGKELDRVAFLGTGTGQPTGIDAQTGVLSVAHSAAISSYAVLVSARLALMTQNATQVSAWVMHPEAEADFGGLVDTTGQPLRHPPILDRPSAMRVLTTTQIPTDGGAGTNETTIFAGDFQNLAIGVRNQVRVEVLRERYADNFQYGFLAHMRADVQMFQPKAFVKITGVQV